MKTALLPICFFIVGSVHVAKSAEVTEFIFPATSQSIREISMESAPSIRGKILFYVPARVAIEKEDGSIVTVQPIQLAESELKLFPSTAHSTLAGMGEKFESLRGNIATAQQSSESAMAAGKAAIVAFNAHNVELAKRVTRIEVLEKEVTELKNEIARKTAANGGWRDVAIFRGSGSQKSDTFTVTAKQWRARWRSAGRIDVYFYAPGGRSYEEHFSSPEATKDTMGYAYKPGTFYLETNSSAAWEVVIEVKG